MTNTWVKRLLAGSTLLGASVVGVVAHNEGFSNTTYYDSAGIATICYGETKNVKPGEYRTKSQCDAQLSESLRTHAKVFDNVPASTPDVVALGLLDFAYNVGVSGANQSSTKKAIMRGDFKEAGIRILDWKYITITKNGKKVKYDCSQWVNGKPNKVCYGIWERRLWQSKAVSNQFKDPGEALRALTK